MRTKRTRWEVLLTFQGGRCVRGKGDWGGGEMTQRRMKCVARGLLTIAHRARLGKKRSSCSRRALLFGVSLALLSPSVLCSLACRLLVTPSSLLFFAVVRCSYILPFFLAGSRAHGQPIAVPPKITGYLAPSLTLSPNHEFRSMPVNQMWWDLASPNMLEAAAALTALCELGK